MKRFHILNFISLSILGVAVFSGCHKTQPETSKTAPKEITVYAYDSFLGEWGPGNELKNKFEAKTGLAVNFVDCGDAVQVLSKAILEKAKVQADVIIGLDNNSSKNALDEGILQSYKPENADSIISDELRTQLCDDWQIVPYDFSNFAIIMNTKAGIDAPKSLADLTDSKYKKKIILMDPRTSTPGLGFVAWTAAIFGDSYTEYWAELKNNVLTMAPGWSAGWGLFEKGEAPLVISYTTSPAATLEYNGATDYEALIFDEGHSIQVEGAAILKNAPNPEGAKKFMDFLISEEAQNVLPLTQWMYPANKNVVLPESYRKAAPIPQKTVSADPAKLEEAVTKVMEILQ